MKIVTTAQMAALEQASERRGVSTDALMENAGLRVAGAARKRLGTAAEARVLALVGPGNNGADGLVAARHLRRWGAEVTAYVVARRPDPDPKMEIARRYGVNVLRADDDLGLAELDRILDRCRLVIDAVLGAGRARPLEGRIKEVMLRVNSRRARFHRPYFLALDLPTGLNGDTGEVDPYGLSADLTVALGFPKAGLLTFPGAERVGQLKIVDIGLPPDTEEERGIELELLTPEWVSRHLPVRPLNSHKGTFGHTLIVAGSRNYVGTTYLTSQAAVRVGAGLVTLATPESVYTIAAAKLTEAIHLPLTEDSDGRIHPDAAELIRRNLSRYDSMVIGSGLGWSAGTTEFLERLLVQEPQLEISMVADADGLNNLSQVANWWQRLRGPAVLTPHPGEMATLTGASTSEVQQDRVATARRWAACWNVTVVLKGAHTVIAEPGGLVRVSPFANPGLASGGTGDVLTGMLGGLMAQGLSPYRAACSGVYIHGQAAASVTRRKGNTGTIASDLIEELPATINRLRRQLETVEGFA
jgi:ADP-dependent NAD(P)H-hydrate dehydratase / NAD(P)H-hydrate epimerase